MRPKNIDSEIKSVIGNVPVAAAAGALTGAAIDRQGYDSLVLVVATGAITGAPTSQTVDSKITHSDTSGGTYTDVAGAAIAQITAASTLGKKAVNLDGVKRFLKVVTTVAFVAGTSPTIGVQSTVVLGGAQVLPAA